MLPIIANLILMTRKLVCKIRYKCRYHQGGAKGRAISTVTSDHRSLHTMNGLIEWNKTRAAYIIVSSVDSGDIFFMLSFEEQYIPRS